MPQYNKADLDLSADGDLIVDETGDLELALDEACARDDILVRLLTQNPDWYDYPSIGADLDEMIGEPNDRITAEEIVRRIKASLTMYGLISPSELDVVPIPISQEEVMFFIAINKPGMKLTSALKYNYETGIEEVQ